MRISANQCESVRINANQCESMRIPKCWPARPRATKQAHDAQSPRPFGHGIFPRSECAPPHSPQPTAHPSHRYVPKMDHGARTLHTHDYTHQIRSNHTHQSPHHHRRAPPSSFIIIHHHHPVARRRDHP
ncbi:hypothetical protein K504DRAFT_69131 [Pleomassaria siparia CBS 279.74]|uniref:Uncharacterized protein n=1 Tax=Pleomassaria siparia CBS 279.74 TaxID=1314801 RepID=A0A6G1K1X1_9PLEO|nr:hypothetical protein K504DRAFT_69131 [Pleomassaria siparia CBS 279.74]